MRLTQDEMLWIGEQAKRHVSLYASKVYSEQVTNNALSAWSSLQKQMEFAISGRAVNLTFSRNSLRILRRYTINATEALRGSIIPGYKKRLDLPGGERYLKYIQAAEDKLSGLLEPLLNKIEREFN